MNVTVIGAGWSGAVIARRLADAGHRVTVFERRRHVGGNCHTERRHGVMVHAYGPHIFHTADDRVWEWVQRWGEFRPYRLQVRSTTRGEVFSLPVNLHTINQLFHQAWTPDEARRALNRQPCEPATFSEAAEAAIGATLYRRLFYGYTRKQWGINPDELPASVFKRLPVRFSYDDNYFDHPHQGIPVDGYTALIERVLDHPDIRVVLNADTHRPGDHTFYTGPIDGWFGFRHGRLRYRTLEFDWLIGDGDRQGCALMNWPDLDVPWTRVTEHNHLAPWESHPVSVRSVEYPKDTGPGDEPFYPLRLARDRELLDRYVADATETSGVTFLGRLGTYRYLDMDVTIREAHDVANRFLAGDVRPLYVAV